MNTHSMRRSTKHSILENLYKNLSGVLRQQHSNCTSILLVALSYPPRRLVSTACGKSAPLSHLLTKRPQNKRGRDT